MLIFDQIISTKTLKKGYQTDIRWEKYPTIEEIQNDQTSNKNIS